MIGASVINGARYARPGFEAAQQSFRDQQCLQQPGLAAAEKPAPRLAERRKRRT
jgi:hypothetical protein